MLPLQDGRAQKKGVNRFVEPHGLLHQHSVDQLAEAVFGVVNRDDIVDGCRARPGLESNAGGGNAAQVLEQVGNRPVAPRRGTESATVAGVEVTAVAMTAPH